MFLYYFHSHVWKVIKSTLILWLDFFYLTNVSWWILLMWRCYSFLFYCMLFQVHCNFLHYTWRMRPIFCLYWLFMRWLLLFLFTRCFSIFANFQVTLCWRFLFLSFCCIFWSWHSNFWRTKHTVHKSIRIGLSFVSFDWFLFPQIKSSWWEILFHLNLIFFDVWEVIDRKVNVNIFRLFINHIRMIHFSQIIDRHTVVISNFLFITFRVNIMRVDICRLCWSINLIRHFTNKFMN